MISEKKSNLFYFAAIPFLFLTGLCFGASLMTLNSQYEILQISDYSNDISVITMTVYSLLTALLIGLISAMLLAKTFLSSNKKNANLEIKHALFQIKEPLTNVYTATENLKKLFSLKQLSSAWNIDGQKDILLYELESCSHAYHQFTQSILRYGYSLDKEENSNLYQIQKTLNFTSGIIAKYIKNHELVDQTIAAKALDKLNTKTMELRDFENNVNQKLISLR